MKFSIIINKWANFYFFVQNLSEWHFSNRKEYNILWRSELGQFSPEEENALKKFKEIRLKYKTSKSHFERAFFTAKSPFEELKKHLPAEEYDALREIFDLFKDKFNLLHEKDLPLLRQWQKNLNKKINDHSLIKSITNILSVLYAVPSPKKTINVYLLFSSPDRTGGGANIDEQSITVETSRYPLEGINNAIGIIWHEVIHLCFEKKYFLPLLINYFKQDSAAISLVIELTVSSLFPKGVIGQDILYLPKPKILNTRIPSEFNETLLNIMKEYIEGRKKLDKNYIVNIFLGVSSLRGKL